MKATSEVYLGLGANLGDREGSLRSTLELLASTISLQRCSSIYETEPWGYSEQPVFLNAVCFGQTALGPLELLDVIKNIERRLGRLRSFQYGPRVIDVDILFFWRFGA